MQDSISELSIEQVPVASLEPSSRRRELGDFFARAVIGVFYLLLSVNVLADFMATRQVTGLLMLLSQTLVVVLTVLRQPTEIIDRSTLAAVTTTVSIVGPSLLQTTGASLVPDALSAVISAGGLCLVIGGKLTLGRSFGLLPANRGVIVRGPYQFVRHPIYTGYLISHVAFLGEHLSLLNISVVLAADATLVVRALAEERMLEQDETYRAYCRRVSWHLVPGLF